MNGLLTALITVLVFMFIILVHEFGHFIAAKAMGVTVHEFSIGFGPVIWKKQGKSTLYCLRLFPIGGFVKLEGEDESSDDPGALNNKPAWKRLIVMAAGATFNLILGLIVFVGIYMNTPEFPTLKIGEFIDEAKGTATVEVLQPGDEIVSFNGKRMYYYKDLSFVISMESNGNPIELTIKRDGQYKDVTVNPVYSDGRYLIGFKPMYEQVGFFEAIKYGIMETFFTMRLVIYSLMMLVTGKVGISDMSGPVGASTVIGQAASAGAISLFNIFAMLSVNVGLFNLIPFPALDGGRIFFLLIEMVRRKPIPPEKEGMVHFVGLVLLLILMVFVTSSDIYKLFLPKG
ncbi:MAG: RIP metalloprotease RseP [Clostridia bacterium]|nr:RIP metalloprotease RseP [Clostridia bacterium]